MTPAILLSDLHIDEYKAFSQSRDRDRLEDCLKVLEDVYKSAKKRNAKVILFSGDFFNTPKYLYVKALTRTLEKLTSLIAEQPDIVWYCITGQHDFTTKNLLHRPTISSIEHLTIAFPNNFRLLDNDCYIGYDYMVYGIPNYEFKEHFRTKLEEASRVVTEWKAGRPHIKATLMIHQSPAGQDNPNVRTQTVPEDPLYEVFDMVICGDIHTSKRITEKFLIAGNPYHKDLGDAGKEKGIWYLDLEDPANTLKFITRKGRYPEFRRVARGQPVADDTEDFIIQEAEIPETTDGNNVASVDEFGATLPHDTLLTNFYNTVHGNDPELLKVGLAFLPK